LSQIVQGVSLQLLQYVKNPSHKENSFRAYFSI